MKKRKGGDDHREESLAKLKEREKNPPKIKVGFILLKCFADSKRLLESWPSHSSE